MVVAATVGVGTASAQAVTATFTTTCSHSFDGVLGAVTRQRCVGLGRRR